MRSKTLVVLEDYNVILDTRLDSCSSPGRSVNSCLIDLLKRFHLADCYRFEHPSVPVWTWLNGNGKLKSYSGRIIIRIRDNSSFSCTQFVQATYTDHKMSKYMLSVYSAYRQKSSYRKLKKSILASEACRNRIKELVKRFALKRAIGFEFITFNRQLSLDKVRTEVNLLKALEEELRLGSESQILAERMALDITSKSNMRD